eukprot:TRINITY_DN16103_c0_g1_i4.p1 TRINITY_DN16103_c0_g1~~TRINITY_DN16103_c0_g1_i4.p1  ORF type:complete len:250 (+),score=61.07 TRINITY_DN16103_c0_g1_i4:117-866(+)
MIRRPPRSTLSSSSAASDVYKRQEYGGAIEDTMLFLLLAATCLLGERSMAQLEVTYINELATDGTCRLGRIHEQSWGSVFTLTDTPQSILGSSELYSYNNATQTVEVTCPDCPLVTYFPDKPFALSSVTEKQVLTTIDTPTTEQGLCFMTAVSLAETNRRSALHPDQLARMHQRFTRNNLRRQLQRFEEVASSAGLAISLTAQQTCTTSADCPGSYCMVDPTKTPPYYCHGSSLPTPCLLYTSPSPRDS